MPMTPESNAAQEAIWEAAQEFHAVNLAGTWTMYLVAEPTDTRDSVEIRAESMDYNQALIAVKAKLDEANA